MKDCGLALYTIQAFYQLLAPSITPVFHSVNFHQIMFRIFLIALEVAFMLLLNCSCQMII